MEGRTNARTNLFIPTPSQTSKLGTKCKKLQRFDREKKGYYPSGTSSGSICLNSSSIYPRVKNHEKERRRKKKMGIHIL